MPRAGGRTPGVGSLSKSKSLSSNLSAISGYASIVGDLFSIANTFESGKLSRLISDHNAIMARYEQQFIDIKIGQQLDILDEEESRVLGNARAISGASGFSVASETNFDIERDIITTFAKESAVIRTSGGLEKLRSEFEAQAFDLESLESRRSTKSKIFTSLSKLPGSKGFSTLFKKRSSSNGSNNTTS